MHHCSLFDDSEPGERRQALQVELEAVPELWRATLAVPGEGHLLRSPGQRMLVLGAGPLVHAARAFADLREVHQHGPTDAQQAGDPRIWRDWDHVVAISRDGAEPELLHALRHLPPRVRRTAVTTGEHSRVSPLVDDVVAIAATGGIVSFESATLVRVRQALGADLTALPALAASVLAGDVPVTAPGVDHLLVVGSGWTAALAARAAQSVAAVAGFRAEAYTQRDVRHGAAQHAGASTLVWFLGATPPELVDAVPKGAVIVASGRDPLIDYLELQRLAVQARAGEPPPLRRRDLASRLVA